MALLANPLNRYASHNYIWTLSAMYPGEVNRPEEYRGKTGKLPIIASGGVGNRKTTITEAEAKINKNVEYFIDDVYIDTNVVPNPNSPDSNVATIEFKVYEPYSLGLFLQTMALAATNAGFTNYTQAPYLLTLQFKGFKDDGTYEEVDSKQFVIKIGAIDFSADQGGSIYNVRAHFFNYEGLSFARQGIKEEITLKGATVAEILGFGEQGLATILNKRELINQKSNFKIISDQYQVRFPFDISPDAPAYSETGPLGGIGSVLNDIQQGLDRVNATIEAVGNLGNSLSNLGSVVSNIGSTGFGGLNASPTPSVRVNSTLETIGDAITELATAISVAGAGSIANEIGTSPMISDFNEFGSVEFENEQLTWDEERGVFIRGNMSISPTTREYTFAAGTTIEQIISSIVLLSKWGQGFVDRPVDRSGMRPWYRIKIKTYILSVAEMASAGRPAYQYVFEVYPYFIHQSTVSLPFADNDLDVVIDDCVKAYNYVYTGLNRDIINFEMNFNSSYFMGRPADNNQANITRLTSFGGAAVEAPNPSLTMPADAGGFSDTISNLRSTIEEITTLYRIAGGTFIDTNRTRVAQTFRNLILNSQADLNTIELTIWGDPYYINSSDSGNYVSPPLKPNINADLEIDYLRSEVFVLVKFNTPVDYNNNLLLSDPADQFTGVYKVNQIENYFQNGQFKQILRMSRVLNQSPSSISKLKRVVDSFFATIGAISNLASVLGADQVSSGLNNFMQEAAPVADQLLGLAQIGANLDQIVSGNYQTLGDTLVGLENFFSNVQALESTFRGTLDSLRNVDLNPLTPPTSPRPLPRPPTRP